MSDLNIIKLVKQAAETSMNLFIDAPPGHGGVLLARYYHALQLAPHDELNELINHTYERSGLGCVEWGNGVPFRAPHYTVSVEGLRGDLRRPGELELAQGGVLYLDEVFKFRRSGLRTIGEVIGHMHAPPAIVATTTMGGDVHRLTELLGVSFASVRLEKPLDEPTARQLWLKICEVRP